MKENTRRILKTASMTLICTVLMMLAVVSCLSCENGPASKSTKSQGEIKMKIFWESLLTDSEWIPQTAGNSPGTTPFAEDMPLNLKVSRQNHRYLGRYCKDTFEMIQVEIIVYGTTGLMIFKDGDEYQMSFSRNPDGTEPVMAVYFEKGNATCYSLKKK